MYEKGQTVRIKKPDFEGKCHSTNGVFWDSNMDRHDGEIGTVISRRSIGNAIIYRLRGLGWHYEESWLTPVEDDTSFEITIALENFF